MPGMTALEYIGTAPEDSPFWTYQPTAYRYRADQKPCERCWLHDGRVAFHPHNGCVTSGVAGIVRS